MNNISDTILSDEHKLLRDETERFVTNEVRPEASERDPKKEEMSAELVDQLGEMGFSAFSSTRSTADSGWT